MLEKGMIVNYKGGWSRLTAVFKNTVNLGYVWDPTKNITKGVPIEDVFEDSEAFYANWRQSESYMCM